MGLVARQHVLLPSISMKMSRIISKRQTSFLILVTSKPLDYATWDMMEEIVDKNVKQSEDIGGLSAAISGA